MEAQDGGKTYNVVINSRLRCPAVLAPPIVDEFNRSFKLVRALPCDVQLGDHPAQYNMQEKYAKLQRNAGVKSFFTDYETANAIFDVEQIAACYADVCMFGGTESVRCVKKEDFLKVLPRRKEFFRSRGLVSSNIDSLEASTLDSKYRNLVLLSRISVGVFVSHPSSELALFY